MKKSLLILSLIVCAVCFASCKGDPGDQGPAGNPSNGILVVSFQQGLQPYIGYTGVMDSYMDSLNPNTKNMSVINLDFGNNSGTQKTRALIKFDLTSISPNNIKVKKAYLSFNNANSAGSVMHITAYKMTRYWDVNSTWNQSVTGLSWAGAEGHYSATAASDTVVLDGLSTEITLSLDTAMVQDWIENSLPNEGVLIKAQEDGTTTYGYIDCTSADGSTNPGDRPKLTIYYTLP